MCRALLVDRSVDARRNRAYDFFVRNLNFSLAAAIEARVRRGAKRTRPGVVLLGPSLPVPRCANYSWPVSSLRDVLNDEAAGAEGHPYAASWRHNVRIGGSRSARCYSART